jgi:hypothetical protein
MKKLIKQNNHYSIPLSIPKILLKNKLYLTKTISFTDSCKYNFSDIDQYRIEDNE